MPPATSNASQRRPRPPFVRTLLQPRNLAFGALGAAVLTLVAILGHRILFSPSKAPPPAALESAAAAALGTRHGGLYTLAHFTPGPALDRAPLSTSPIQPAGASPVSPVSPVAAAPAPDGRLHYKATLTAKLAETLYAPVNTIDYIERELKLDTSPERKIEEILRGPGGPRIRELAGIGNDTASLASMRLIRETARAGARFEMGAHIEASRAGDEWRTHIVSLTPKTPLPQGEPLGKFSGRLIDITRESDIAALRRAVAQTGETLRRVEAARERHRAELAANATRVVSAKLAQLTPGALYSGKATLPGRQAMPDICLEIVSIDRDASTLRANLRADSSWIDARPLEGRYGYDTGSDLFTITLSARAGLPVVSASGLAVAGAKPFRITLHFSGSELTGDAGEWSCKLARVPDSSRASMIATFSASEQKLLDATRPGRAYRVHTETEGDLLLRFKTQNPATGALTATIENIHGPWKHELQGSLIASPARSGGFPVRLLTTLDSTQPNIPSIGLSLRLENGNVFKGSIRMIEASPVTLEPAGAEFLAEVDALARARAGRKHAASQDAINIAPLPGNAAPPTRPVPASPATPPPGADGAYIWDETAWRPLPSNNARVVRSTLQKVGGVWSSAISLIKTRPEKQETGTLTFDGTDIPPSVSGRDVLLAFRGAFVTYPGTPVGLPPIEVAPLEIKGRGRKRVAELERLGDAAATFGKASERVIIDRSETEPGLYVIRAQRPLPAGRYALHAPEHSFEFEVRARD
ncbi:hypothetical protein M2447_001881 [Ereboglobus sp. PH5-10]|uniref:hypothetical protein n=1 Tax=Ereboglobus sp. PH5-10 TaxID=2940629 RepID=UPI00240770BE|nr:hypothetical protein [Ereboglobus sp. PH5-10]MDF9827779.1 hypothetical protein [Ereboglobus sp. PH5-10]